MGQNYTLVCSILSRLEGLNAVISGYQWTKDNGTKTQIGTNSSILSFSSLRLSDTGLYTCDISVNSNKFLSRQAVVTTTIRLAVSGDFCT